MVEVVCRFVDCHVFRRTPSGDEWLVMLRAPHCVVPNTWQMVQGGVEPGEKAYEAALRELREETALTPIAFYQTSYVNRFYLAIVDQIILSPVFCVEVDQGAIVILNDEHTDYKWVSWEEAMNGYPWPGQKKSLKICREQFVLNEPRPESNLASVLRGEEPRL